jgi:hypothetical protein
MRSSRYAPTRSANRDASGPEITRRLDQLIDFGIGTARRHVPIILVSVLFIANETYSAH